MEDESNFINDFYIYTETFRKKARRTVETPNPIPLSTKLNQFLYSKYSSSQNYYYTKDINNILGGNKTPAVIMFTDLLTYYKEEHLLKRLYKSEEYPQKIVMLSEYYKYHEDVPRLFMMPVASVVHNYYDKKRRINYIKITRMLREENPDMTGSNVSNINIHDSDTSLSLDNDETLPRSLYKLLPDEMTPKHAKDHNETSDRKDRLASSLTVYDLTDILGDIFKKSGKLLEKRKINGKVLKYSKLDSESSLSFQISGLQQWSTKHHMADDDIANISNNRKLFLSNKDNNYIATKPVHKQLNIETTKNGKMTYQKRISELQPGAFKKKKEAVHESKNVKLSSLKNEDFLKKLASRNIDVKNLVKKGNNLRFILNTDKVKESKDDRKDKFSNLNINNLNININFNGTSKSNRLIGSKKTGSLGFSAKQENAPVSLIAESPSYSLLKNQKNESNRDRETRGRSINFTNFRNWNGSNEHNLNTRTMDRNSKFGDLSTKMKDSEGLINLNHLRKSLKNKPSFATFYMSKQGSTIQALKSSEFFKSKEQDKGLGLTKAKLLKANSPTIKDQHKMVREMSKEVKLSQRRQKSKTSTLNYNNQLKIFMSQDYKENKLKVSTASKPTKHVKSSKPNKKNRSPAENHKQHLKELLEDGGIYSNKFSTFGASFKGRSDDHAGNSQFNTISNVHIFNKKKSHSNNTIKVNIENSIKGNLRRKNP